MKTESDQSPKYFVIAIRNLGLSLPWAGSYFVGICDTLEDAIELAKKEKEDRGGYKYGCVIYSNIPDATEVYRTT